MPWRKTKNPYKILVSEVMLQQTQVSRVLEKYPEFLKAFPAVETLAKAPLSEVLKVWQGMGYNRRGLALKRMAEKVLTDHKGKVPHERGELESLPGVGPYTAGAVRAFAFDEPEIFIETNIRRIFIHHFFKDKEGIGDREIYPLVEATLDTKNPRAWYWALMDYGSRLPKVVRKNSNTQSKHYVKQSTFKGSLRELRGKIIRTLGDKPQTLVSLKRVCDNDERIKEALDALSKDSLIKYEKRKYQLA
ncbi:MAG: A/G-specific adenine glycosylase [Candidatus Pacebacteria bacterium]|nr:A/G-specific adenine glycosylase [Candidatus Paceibacterota bacterium]